MTATLMDGRAVAAQLLQHTGQRADQFRARRGLRPCLATVLVGDDPASADRATLITPVPAGSDR